MQLNNVERILSLIGHVCKISALFLPWMMLSLILVENETALDSRTYIISMVYANSMKFGDVLYVNFGDYMILSLISAGSSLILIIHECYRIKQTSGCIGIGTAFGIRMEMKDSDFIRYLQIFSQISALLVVLGVFSILSEIKFIHPMMSAELQIEGGSQKLIVESKYSIGLYIWLLSIILSGSETLSNASLVYSSLGGISSGRAEKISKKITSIINYYMAAISSNDNGSKALDNSIKNMDIEKRLFNNRIIENRNENVDLLAKSNALDEFNKLFLKKK